MLDTAAQAIVKVVLPHDAGHARVGENVGIAGLLSLVAGERPMLLGAACSHHEAMLEKIHNATTRLCHRIPKAHDARCHGQPFYNVLAHMFGM